MDSTFIHDDEEELQAASTNALTKADKIEKAAVVAGGTNALRLKAQYRHAVVDRVFEMKVKDMLKLISHLDTLQQVLTPVSTYMLGRIFDCFGTLSIRSTTYQENTRVWFDDLLAKSIDIYDDLKKAFLENYLQQKKCIKDPIEIHNIKQQDAESTEDFVKRYKLESRDVKGAPECIRISRFMHGMTNPELIKRLHNKILKNS
nr:reverse transcriptase domain-containing protein [Tanacetum cinerariifolium]